MNLVYFILSMIVFIAVFIDSLTLLFMVLASLMLLPNCGRTLPTEPCTINGEDCHAKQDTGVQGPQGNDGATGPQGPSAPAGRDGTDGTSGTNGNAGESCTVVQGIGGATISCGDGTSEFISNGSDGVAGTDGQDGVDGTNGTNGTNGTGVAVVDPCGSQTDKDDTLLIIGSKVYGVVIKSNKTILTDLVPGVYTTRDGTNCHYTVHANATVTW